MFITLLIKDPMLATGLALMLWDSSLNIMLNRDVSKVGRLGTLPKEEAVILDAVLGKLVVEDVVNLANRLIELPIVVVGGKFAATRTLPGR